MNPTFGDRNRATAFESSYVQFKLESIVQKRYPRATLVPPLAGPRDPSEVFFNSPLWGASKKKFLPSCCASIFAPGESPRARCWSSQRQKSPGWPLICVPPCTKRPQIRGHPRLFGLPCDLFWDALLFREFFEDFASAGGSFLYGSCHLSR